MGTRNLPTGTVTFLFTDVEGSTKLLRVLGADRYAEALGAHRAVLRAAFAQHGGVEVDTQGDAFFVAFPTASGALRAALDARHALADGPISVRIGVHTGVPLLTDEGYVGADVHKGARIAAAGHGGQILVSATTAALLDGTTLRDLGQHRLKDLAAPERIFQADDAQHPQLKTLHQTNLPVPATPFLGRQADLEALTALLTRTDVRLVTLTGPGGTGKTRLALQAAADAADAFPDGVWWVPLAPLRDPNLVIVTAAHAIGAAGEVAEHIGWKRLLLLLDNFEHLVAAADQLGPLLAACPNLAVLVTSREPLRLGGEHEYAVDPLIPSDAVDLFLSRAMAVRRDFPDNGEARQICARLDHLPLAIELAAARVKILSPKALLERLTQRLSLLAGGARDAPERQRTLRATIAWSHELLDAAEQQLFARCAVFRNGWTLEAAEAIADADLDTLQSLVDKSLVRVRPDSGRFWMLETIREFALERLETAGESADLQNRHAVYYVRLAEEAEPLVLRDSQEWLDLLEAEHDNVRAALDVLEATDSAEQLQRLAGALWRFWYLRSHLTEGRRRLEAALGADEAATPRRAKLLLGLSVMILNLGEPEAAVPIARAARDIEEDLGNAWGVAYATMIIGNSLAELRVQRDFAGALVHLNDAAARFEALGDEQYALISRHNQAWITEELGDKTAGLRLHAANLATARRIGNRGIEAEALAQLGMGARDEGRLETAAALLRQAVQVDQERAAPQMVAVQLGRLASVLVRGGEPELGACLIGAAEAVTARLGSHDPWWALERNEESVAIAREALGIEAADRARERGLTLSVEDAVSLALQDGRPQ